MTSTSPSLSLARSLPKLLSCPPTSALYKLTIYIHPSFLPSLFSLLTYHETKWRCTLFLLFYPSCLLVSSLRFFSAFLHLFHTSKPIFLSIFLAFLSSSLTSNETMSKQTIFLLTIFFFLSLSLPKLSPTFLTRFFSYLQASLPNLWWNSLYVAMTPTSSLLSLSCHSFPPSGSTTTPICISLLFLFLSIFLQALVLFSYFVLSPLFFSFLLRLCI